MVGSAHPTLLNAEYIVVFGGHCPPYYIESCKYCSSARWARPAP